MARRRRSLGILGVGSIVFVPVALMIGGIMWVLAAPFALGLVGYLLFLRSQAQRDRDRRYNRQQRAVERRTRSVDVTDERHMAPVATPAFAPEPVESVVRIDDDDIDLHNMDTIDLTGLYNDGLSEAAAQRRAS